MRSSMSLVRLFGAFILLSSALWAASSGDNGGQPTPNEENKKCVASKLETKTKVDIGKIVNPNLKALEEAGKKIPYIKELSVKATGTLEEKKAEECCKDIPTPYRELSGTFGVTGTAEFYLPGAGFKKSIYFRVSLPDFLGGDDLFVVIATAQGGVYGGAKGSAKGVIEYHISEDPDCKQCLSYNVNIPLTGTVGLDLGFKGTAYLFGGGEYTVKAAGDLHGEVSVEGKFKIGLLGCPDLKLQVCLGKTVVSGSVSFQWGRWNYDKEVKYTVWKGVCKGPGSEG